jgi:aspartate carbamoyltransferase regulatory subunit
MVDNAKYRCSQHLTCGDPTCIGHDAKSLHPVWAHVSKEEPYYCNKRNKVEPVFPMKIMDPILLPDDLFNI